MAIDILSAFSPASPLPGQEIRILVALAFTGAAAYYDAFNKKWVPENLLRLFLAASAIVNLLFFDLPLFAAAVALSVAVAVITYYFYRMGQIGGADVFVMTSITLCLPYAPAPLLSSAQSIPYPFILSVLMPAGIFFILHMAALYVPFVVAGISKGKIHIDQKKLLLSSLFIAVMVAFCMTVAANMPVSLAFLGIFCFLGLSLVFFSLFIKEIKMSMAERVSVRRLQCEDVLALEFMPELSKKLKLSPVINERTIKALSRAGVKSVLVYTKMPFFLPYLFLGLVFALLFGDIIYLSIGGF